LIQIHRSKPLVYVGEKVVQLSRDEHRLLIALGMMDNCVAAHPLLLATLCEGRQQIPADVQLLRMKMCRLRRKIGAEYLQSTRLQGYMLKGEVEFIGQPTERQTTR